MTWRFLTSGESHGHGLLVVIDGIPSGLKLDIDCIAGVLARRRRGYGRGARMAIEKDEVQIWGGIRGGKSTGAPIGVSIANSEAEFWDPVMNPWMVDTEQSNACRVRSPRPGHADLSGAIKYRLSDMRDVLERSSARTTAPRAVAGALAGRMLEDIGVYVRGAVTSIGGIKIPTPMDEAGWNEASKSQLGCPTSDIDKEIAARIDKAREDGNSLGGTFMVSIKGVPAGLGSGAEWDRRLDAMLGAAMMSIPGIKGVEIGDGFASAARAGFDVHDEILLKDGTWRRMTNRAGGLEGGMSNGEEILIHMAMKPIPTMRKALRSVDIVTKEQTLAHSERSDVCAVPAACVVAEAMAAWIVGGAVVEKFGGDTISELKERFSAYRSYAERWLLDDQREE